MSKPNPNILRGRGGQGVGVIDTSAEARFGRRVVPQLGGCWAFNGELHTYGTFALTAVNGMKPEVMKAHRFAYETMVGPVPDDHHLHHECGNPGCVNPAHLIPLSPVDHARRHVEIRKTGVSRLSSPRQRA